MRVRISFDALRLCLLVAAGVTSGYLWRAAFESSAPLEQRTAVRPPPFVEKGSTPRTIVISPKHLSPQQTVRVQHGAAVSIRVQGTSLASDRFGPSSGSSSPSTGGTGSPPKPTPAPKPTPKPTPAPTPAPTPQPPAPQTPPTQPAQTPPVAAQPQPSPSPSPSPSPEPKPPPKPDPKPEPKPEPPPTPQPPPSGSGDDKPGWGDGDKNHDHTGPPGKNK